jgi:hypothetical protein
MALSTVKFFIVTSAQYNALETKDSNALYFLSDANRIYKGSVPYSHPIELVTEFPATGLVGTLYVNTTTKEGKAWNGTSWITVQLAVSTTVEENDTTLPTGKAVKNFVEEALQGFVNGATFDGATGLLSLATPSGTPIEINLPVETFLSAASYDADAHKLTLTLTDNTKFDVDLADLIDTYTGGTTESATVDITEGVVTANVKVSATEGNLLNINTDGLYVAPLTWQTIEG